MRRPSRYRESGGAASWDATTGFGELQPQGEIQVFNLNSCMRLQFQIVLFGRFCFVLFHSSPRIENWELQLRRTTCIPDSCAPRTRHLRELRPSSWGFRFQTPAVSSLLDCHVSPFELQPCSEARRALEAISKCIALGAHPALEI